MKSHVGILSIIPTILVSVLFLSYHPYLVMQFLVGLLVCVTFYLLNNNYWKVSKSEMEHGHNPEPSVVFIAISSPVTGSF